MPLRKAVQIARPGADLVLVEKEIPEPGEREVLIKVEACGVCHGDAVARFGARPGTAYPRVPGHEVVGTVVKQGPGVVSWRPDTRVGVGWSGGWCGACEACSEGRYQECRDSWITGLSVDGGYADYMVARTSALVSIPDELSSVDAAPLLCAGATTFSALQESGAIGGEVVAIHGIGGLGHLGIQYANRLGFTTVAVSRGSDKESLARELGAHHYIDAQSSDAAAELRDLGGARRKSDLRPHRRSRPRGATDSRCRAPGPPRGAHRAAVRRWSVDQGVARPAAGRRDRLQPSVQGHAHDRDLPARARGRGLRQDDGGHGTFPGGAYPRFVGSARAGSYYCETVTPRKVRYCPFVTFNVNGPSG